MSSSYLLHSCCKAVKSTLISEDLVFIGSPTCTNTYRSIRDSVDSHTKIQFRAHHSHSCHTNAPVVVISRLKKRKVWIFCYESWQEQKLPV